MERDFLGMNEKESGNIVRDDGRGSRPDCSALLGGPVVQWPFSNKIAALQQFMTYRAGQDERSKKTVLEQLSSSGFQPMETGSSQLQPSQKGFSLNQFPAHNYQSQMISLGVSAKSSVAAMHHSIPVASNSPLFKVHGSSNNINLTVANIKQHFFGGGLGTNVPASGSTAATFTPRTIPTPCAATAQLTIFYAGSVNVYDSVPLDKAQAIMYMASKMSNASPKAVPEVPAPTIPEVVGGDGLTMNQMQSQTQTPTHQNHVTSPCSGMSSSVSASSNTGAQPGSGCSTTNEIAAGNSKNVGPFAPTSQHEPLKVTTTTMGSAAPVSGMPRAIPQARKASLARFLEKRKERVTSSAPYTTAKKTPEKSAEFDDPSSKSTSADIASPSNREDAWSFGCTNKNSINCQESPSTKLEM